MIDVQMKYMVWNVQGINFTQKRLIIFHDHDSEFCKSKGLDPQKQGACMSVTRLSRVVLIELIKWSEWEEEPYIDFPSSTM